MCPWSGQDSGAGTTRTTLDSGLRPPIMFFCTSFSFLWINFLSKLLNPTEHNVSNVVELNQVFLTGRKKAAGSDPVQAPTHSPFEKKICNNLVSLPHHSLHVPYTLRAQRSKLNLNEGFN